MSNRLHYLLLPAVKSFEIFENTFRKEVIR